MLLRARWALMSLYVGHCRAAIVRKYPLGASSADWARASPPPLRTSARTANATRAGRTAASLRMQHRQWLSGKDCGDLRFKPVGVYSGEAEQPGPDGLKRAPDGGRVGEAAVEHGANVVEVLWGATLDLGQGL